MITTIDRAGRLVIPKAIRDRLGLRGGEQVEVEERDGEIRVTRRGEASSSCRLSTGC
jgi:AbrB family looped-hinge helix DNA binding protein